MSYPHRSFFTPKCTGRKIVETWFAFKPQGTGAVGAANIVQAAEGIVKSVTRTAVGKFTVALHDDWPAPVYASAALAENAPGGVKAHVEQFTVGTGSGSTFDVHLRQEFREPWWFKDADDSAAGDATPERTIAFEEAGGRIIDAAGYLPNAAVAADASNTALITLRKRPVSAPTSPVTVMTYDTTTGQEGAMTAWVANFGTLSGTPANLVLSAGDTLTLEISKSGTGVIIPAGLFQVSYQQLLDVAANDDNVVHCHMVFDLARQS